MNYQTIGRKGPPQSHTDNGTLYVELTHCGVAVDGQEQGAPAASEDDAWKLYRAEFDLWLNGRDPKGVVWRIYPEANAVDPVFLQWHRDGSHEPQPTPTDKRVWMVYSRLAYEAETSAAATAA